MGIDWKSCCSSWAKLTRTPTRRTLVGKTVRKNIDVNWLGKSTKLGTLIRSKKTKVIPAGLCGWHQHGRKEAEFSSYVEEIDEERWYWGTNIIPWSRSLRMHSTGMQAQTRKSLDNTTICLNPVFPLEQPRNYQDGTNRAQKLQRGPATWKDMLENAWDGIIANL